MTDIASLPSALDQARHRELAIEHLLFGTLRFLVSRHPELLDDLQASVEHLGDMRGGEARDHEAVRDVARSFLKSLRAER